MITKGKDIIIYLGWSYEFYIRAKFDSIHPYVFTFVQILAVSYLMKGNFVPSEKNVNWSELYSCWKYFSMSTGWNKKISFTPVAVLSPSVNLQIGNEIYDWWPVDEIANRRDALEKDGIAGVYWETKKGTLHTAELLYSHLNNQEIQVAILIAASIWNKLNPLPEEWHGELYRLYNDLFRFIVYDSQGPFCFHGLNVWHHAMRDALPVNIVTEEFAEYSKPRKNDDIVYIAFLETALSTSFWTPVVVSNG